MQRVEHFAQLLGTEISLKINALADCESLMTRVWACRANARAVVEFRSRASLGDAHG
jgi:hypothetical protein